MIDKKRKKIIPVVFIWVLLCGVVLRFQYLSIIDEKADFWTVLITGLRVLIKGLLAAVGFLIVLYADLAMKFLWEQELHISDEIIYYAARPHVLLSNMTYGHVIEIKISFQLFNDQERDKRAPPNVRIQQVETVSLSSVAGRVSKTEASKTYIEMPDRLLKCWRHEKSDDSTMLVVQATSVHSVTNFRAITNAAVFRHLDAFDEAQ